MLMRYKSPNTLIGCMTGLHVAGSAFAAVCSSYCSKEGIFINARLAHVRWTALLMWPKASCANLSGHPQFHGKKSISDVREIFSSVRISQ
jgi:hypothetical protein